MSDDLGDRTVARAVYVGQLWPGGTARHRRDALARLVAEVSSVDTTSGSVGFGRFATKIGRKIGIRFDIENDNSRLLDAVDLTVPNIVWLDKPLTVRRRTLDTLRHSNSSPRIVAFSGDDFLFTPNTSRRFVAALPAYDLVVTTKSHRVADLFDHGARDVLFVNNSFEPDVHRPHFPTNSGARVYEAAFIGAYEDSRCRSIQALADSGIHVHVWGSVQWAAAARESERVHYEGGYVADHEYADALSRTQLGLGFLTNKPNVADQQTTRSVEIPACGALLLAERASEHQSLFTEESEAVFFSDDLELVACARRLLDDDQLRFRIAQAGLDRTMSSDYSNTATIGRILNRVLDCA